LTANCARSTKKSNSTNAKITRLKSSLTAFIKEGVKERLTESVKTALKLTGGAVLVSIVDGEEKLYSEKMACVNCGINIAAARTALVFV
jgi:excinuclease UvrABC ATPase subunit